LGYHDYQIAPASSDASFRRYFRVTGCGEPVIVMDAPPERERCDKFVRVARAFAGLGIHVPSIWEENLNEGFLLLSDLGARQYFTALSPENADLLYGDALDTVLRLQRGEITDDLFPPYDRALLERELMIFREWFLDKHLHLVAQDAAVPVLDQAFSLMVEAALEQPRVWVHRDFHSRNLMVVDQNNPGVLDFQDAVMGPITYDLVSLLRDC
jgi:aminoglycoside/choline kinase family phosphotransferase